MAELTSAPYSKEAEQGILGSILIDKNCVPLVVDKLKFDDFYDELNREIYRAMYTIVSFSRDMDPVFVKEDVVATGRFDENMVALYLYQLMNNTPSSSNVKEYVEIVKDRSLLRSLGTVATDVVDMVQSRREKGSSVLDVVEQRISDLRQGRVSSGLTPIDQVMDEVQEHLIELSQTDSTISGLSTGLSDLDNAISGLNKSDLILLAARPAMGKTSFALNLLLNVGKHSKKSVAFFSLEMSKQQLGMRLISTESFVDNKKLVTGQLGDQDWVSVMAACESLNQTKILISDDAMSTVADINAKCRRVKDLGLIVIDYLQLMQSAGGKSSGGENRQQVVSDISRSLKIMAKDLNVPVICLSQLSRASEKRENKRPMLSDLRESGAIEQDADIVMFLFREDYYDKDSENHNIAECIIAKNRHGETRTVELEWVPQFTTFRGLERRYGEPD